jgi:hypothetical protein
MGWAAEPGPIQVLDVKLHVKEIIRTEGLADPLPGHHVSRVSHILAEKDQDPFRLFSFQ